MSTNMAQNDFQNFNIIVFTNFVNNLVPSFVPTVLSKDLIQNFVMNSAYTKGPKIFYSKLSQKISSKFLNK